MVIETYLILKHYFNFLTIKNMKVDNEYLSHCWDRSWLLMDFIQKFTLKDFRDLIELACSIK
jgi:hypothetical protein